MQSLGLWLPAIYVHFWNVHLSIKKNRMKKKTERNKNEVQHQRGCPYFSVRIPLGLPFTLQIGKGACARAHSA